LFRLVSEMRHICIIRQKSGLIKIFGHIVLIGANAYFSFIFIEFHCVMLYKELIYIKKICFKQVGIKFANNLIKAYKGLDFMGTLKKIEFISNR
jgi:hypothetical protein